MLIYLQGLGYTPTLISQISSSAQIVGMLTAMLTGGIAQRIGNKWMWVTGIGSAGAQQSRFPKRQRLADCGLVGHWGYRYGTCGDWQCQHFDLYRRQTQIGVLASLYILCFTIGGVVGNPLLGWIIAH
jgi:MFS family permease